MRIFSTKKNEHGTHKFYSRNINQDGEQNLLKYPQDCYDVLFEEIPSLMPLKLDWEYYGVTGENKKLFRVAPWGRYTIYQGITNSDVWRKISELPDDSTPYIYPKDFKYAINPNNLNTFYISMLQRGKYTYFEVDKEEEVE